MRSGLASRLRSRVALERRAQGRDEAGGRLERFAPLGTRAAEVTSAVSLSAAALDGGARHSGGRWIVTLRDQPFEGSPLDYRLRHRGALLAVIGVRRDPARPGEVQLLCDAVEVSS